MDPYRLIPPPRRMAETKAKLSPGEMMKEISSSESDVMGALSPYGRNNDPVVRAKGLKIYRDMCEDDQVKACLDLRKHARLSSKWTINPAEEGNSQAEEYADFVNHCIKRMTGNFEQNLYEIYSAIEYGYSISELVFTILDDGPWKGKIGLDSIKSREPFNYDFKIDAYGNLDGLTYIGMKPQMVGTSRDIIPKVNPAMRGGQDWGTTQNPYPPDKFVIYSYNSQFGNWYGRSDLLSAFRSWLSKKIVMRFWNVWLERYASPFVWAQVDADTVMKKEVMDEIDDFLANLSARSGIRLPKGVTLNIAQSSATASASYEQAIEAHNRFIAHSLLFPNLMGLTGSQGSGGSGGTYGLGQVHMDTFIWVLDKMGRDTSETIVGEQIIKRLINMNFPNVDQELMPVFKFEGVDEDSVKKRADIVKTLSDGGFISPDEEWVREFVMLPKKEEGVVLPVPRSQQILGPDGQPVAPSRPGAAAKDPEAKEDEEPEKPAKEAAQEDRPGRLYRYSDADVAKFEKKFRPKDMKRELDETEAQVMAELSIELTKVRDSVISYVERSKMITLQDVREVNNIRINIGAFKDTLRAWMVKIYLDSKLRAFEELGDGGVPVETTKTFATSDWTPLPPREAIDFFNRKVKARIDNKSGKRVLVELASGREIPFYDQKAFAVSGAVRDDLLSDVKQVVLNGIKRQDERGAIKDLKDVFNRYLDSGISVDEELLQPHRLQTIVRTNTVEAVNEGRRALYEDPDVKEFVQFFEYSAILDQRTTDYCRCMDRKIFRIEDIGLLNPPAHYNCRSFSVPVTQFEVDELRGNGRGIEVSQPCPDRASSFKDVRRDPMPVTSLPAASKPIPAPVPPVAAAPVVDRPATPRTQTDLEIQKRLEDELNQLVVRCPYTGCQHSARIGLTRTFMNIGEFQCADCKLPFRVSNTGDLYLYDAGLDRWERVTKGLSPLIFSEAGKRRING